MKFQQSMIVTILTALSIFSVAVELSLAQQARTDYQIGYYQQMLKRNPRNTTVLLGLGDALIRKARETGDPGYFNRAEEALQKALAIAPQNAGAYAISLMFFIRATNLRPPRFRHAEPWRSIPRTATPTAFSATRCSKSVGTPKPRRRTITWCSWNKVSTRIAGWQG